MKVITAIRILPCVAVIALGASLAHAQSEIDPDHFDSPNTEPFSQPKATGNQARTIQYDANFSLPYTVQCNGKKLAPGKYSISFRFDGKVGQALVKSKDQAVEISGLVHVQTRKRSHDVVVVENNGKARRLSAIQASGIVLFAPKSQIDTSSNSRTIRIEELLLTVRR